MLRIFYKMKNFWQKEVALMGTLIDYVLNIGGQSFSEKPFTNVDNLILSLLSYVKFDDLVPTLEENKEPVCLYDAVNGSIEPDRLKKIYNIKAAAQLMPLLLISRRFGRIKLNYYVSRLDEESETQFSAITFILDDGSNFVSYRGTDGTVTGWKEDFNMAFMSPVPAQAQSVEYLNTVAWRLQGDICVGGHSKGGNLAVYASSLCDGAVQKRIKLVFDNDGPGFHEEFFRTSGFLEIEPRLKKFVPKSSIVGMLLDHWCEYTVVDSDTYGILQHDPLSWLVDGYDFERLDSVSAGALLMDDSLNKWISSMSDGQREAFTDALFSILKSTQIKDFMDETGGFRATATAILGAIKGIDPEVRKVLTRTIGSLVSMAAKEFAGGGKLKMTRMLERAKPAKALPEAAEEKE